jgi:catechol 2,3-dioxygenase-like lactoylglutathione lyase family enzyme
MPVQLDHITVPSRDKRAAAKMVADLLGVPWSAPGDGPFCPVYVNAGLTLDFDQFDEPFPVTHYCFRVAESEFDVILARVRAAGIAFRSRVRGPVDMQVDTEHGGRIVYWDVPDGHQWEMLTLSYARRTDVPLTGQGVNRRTDPPP